MPRKSKSPKPCPPGKERNPSTGRCRNVKNPKSKTKKVKSPKPCPPGKERNPSTGRCRTVKSTTSKTKKVKSPKPCPPGKERNPATGRCRNVKSPTSKKNEKDRSSIKNKSPKIPRKSPPKKKSSPRKSPTKSDTHKKKSSSKLKKEKNSVPDYIKYGFVKIDFGIKGPDPIYFSDYDFGSACIIDSSVSWSNPSIPGSSRDKYNELIKRGKELGRNFWLRQEYFKNIKTVSMYIPSGMMVKIWTWDNDAPRVFKAGTYTDQSIVGSTGNGACMFWGGHESRSDEIPDSFRMK